MGGFPDDGVDPQDWGEERQRTTMGNVAERAAMIHIRALPDGHKLVVFKQNQGNRAGAFRADREGNYFWRGLGDQRDLVNELVKGRLPEAKPGQEYRTARGIVTNALQWHPDGGFQIEPQPPTTINHMQGARTVDKTKEAITLMQITNGAQIVSATYMGDTFRHYHFKNVLGLDLEPGDLIVVETRDSYSLATVADPNVDVTAIGCGYDQLVHVAAKVDLTDLITILVSEGRARHQLAMSEVHDRLSTFRKQLGDAGFTAAQNALLGKTDPENAEVVE